ncbi:MULTISPECIES: hypothetical protein [Legionella]|uniref:Uncharacterized protein n=1 Tax=Legionella quinlivanii TaxID=45073 RepID=A0A364LFN1_9GAMM|nr:MULTISPECIES: hypothetical protein [Legionella]RAP34747.1 hypothetical protein B1207_14945 [Legionella quinlivanii]
MTFRSMKSLLTVVVVSCLPAIGFSDDTKTDAKTEAPTFQSTCVNAWMGRNTEITDKMDFKNFGEKYCKCAETQQPLDTQEAINKAAQVCMSRTILQDAMDNVEENVGLDKVTSKDIDDSCHNRWLLVYPKMDENDKKIATSYCDCADPKLVDLSKNSEKMTDDEYYKEIYKIAATCSGKEGK